MRYIRCPRSMRIVGGLATMLLSSACDSGAKGTQRVDTSAARDARTPVALPADGQQAVLREMRQMLAAIGGVVAGAAREDTGAVIAALAPAGSAAAADPALERLLPPAWKELAERTHGGFDSLAVAVRRAPRRSAVKDSVLAGVARISGSCTACHDTFRVTVR